MTPHQFHSTPHRAPSHPSSSASFISWNCHSLNDDHLSELAVVANSHRPLLIALCETRRSPSSSNRPPRLSGYRWVGFDYLVGSGGVGLFIADHLSSALCPELSASQQKPPLPPSPPQPTAQTIFSRVVIPSLRREILVGSLYCPPKDNTQWLVLQDSIRRACDTANRTNTPLLLLGDLNARHSCTGDPVSFSSSASASDSYRGQSLVSLLNDTDLHLLNTSHCYGKATFPDSGSILDIALTTDPSLISVFCPEPALLLHSDHYPMLGRFANLHESAPLPLLPSNSRQGAALSSSSPKLAFERMEIPEFQAALEPRCAGWLQSIEIQRLLAAPSTVTPAAAQEAIESLNSSLSACFLNAAATCAPRLPPERRIINHWFTAIPGVHAALQHYHHAARFYRKNRSDSSRREAYLVSRRAWRAKKAEAKKKAWSDLCGKIADPEHRKLAWSAWHRTLPSAFAPLNSIKLSPQQPLPSSHSESLNRITEHFAATCSSLLDGSAEELSVLDAVEELQQCSVEERNQTASLAAASSYSARSQLNTPFTVAELEHVARQQKTRTALGPDGFSPYFIRHATPTALCALTALLNFSWTFGVMPAAWRSANVMPLLKDATADRSSPTNFRPISLTSILIRFFERVVLRRLRPLISKQLASQQAGFRTNHSTYIHLHRLQHVIASAFRRNRYQSVIFLDVAKAFDSTWHAGILYKLSRPPFSITGRAWHWIRALLIDRQIRVVDQGLQADWRSITAGVPQGSVLAPLLFLIYIDDLVMERVSCEMALYADDIALWGSEDGEEGDEQLRRCLPQLLRWSCRWKLKFNLVKSGSVCFRRKHHDPSRKLTKPLRSNKLKHEQRPPRLFTPFVVPPPFSFSPTGDPALALPQCNSYKYLGLIFDYQLKWAEQTDAVRAKMQQSVNMINRIIPSAASTTPAIGAAVEAGRAAEQLALVDQGPPFHVIRQLTHSIVRSQLYYGLPIWNPATKAAQQQLQSLLVRPLLRSLALPSSTHHLSLLVETASASVASLYQASIVNLYHRLLRLPSLLPSHRLFLEQQTEFLDAWQTPPSKKQQQQHKRGSFPRALLDLPPSLHHIIATLDRNSQLAPMALARELTYDEWDRASSVDDEQPPLSSSPSLSQLSTSSSSLQQSSRPNAKRRLPAPSSSSLSSSSSSSSSPSSSSAAAGPTNVSSAAALTPLPGTSLRVVRSTDSIRPSFYLKVDPLSIARLRARLRLGRARLAASLFVRGISSSPSPSSSPSSPLCPHPPCRLAGANETREHVLLDCPLYDAIRDRIHAVMLRQPSLQREMNIEDALGAVEGRGSGSDRRLILQLTGKLLVAIDQQRHL
jgi:hypothetical protein